MKVLFVFSGLPHYYNAILNKLHAIDHLEVTVVVPEKKSSALGAGVHETDEDIAFKVLKLEEYKAIYGKTYFQNFTKVIEKEQPQIIVLTWPYIIGCVFDIQFRSLCKKLGIKVIFKSIPYQVPKFREAILFQSNINFLDENLKQQKVTFLTKCKYAVLALLEKYYYNWVDAHVNYLEEAFEILGSYGVPEEKIFITYNSPDTDAIFQIKAQIENQAGILPPNPQRLLHVGRLVKWKKVHLLLIAFAKLQKKFPASELVVVGKGPEEENLKRQAQELGIRNQVRFVGAVYEPEELGKYFMNASIYVLAGVGGLSINEAMSYGKPIVCSVCDGTEKKLVREGYNGKYFTNDDAEALYQVLDSLLSNPELITEMGKKSENIIREEVNVHTVIGGYVDAFNFVTHNRYNITYQP